MKNKPRLTNKQRTARGMKRQDNGEISHTSDKAIHSQYTDNVRPYSF